MEPEKIMNIVKEKDLSPDFLDVLLNSTNIQTYWDNCRMIECSDPTTIEYGFQVNGHERYYIMSFGEKIV